MSNERRTLVLLRHAKSDYPAGVGDHERPLAPRGKREAVLAGSWLQSGAVEPVQAVLCSTATRTRQTLERTGIDVPTHFLDRLYGGGPGAILDEINQVSDGFDTDVRSLLVISHEPAISELALGLTGAEGSDAAAAERISTKFPTSAIAVLQVSGPWSALEPGGAALVQFHVPR